MDRGGSVNDDNTVNFSFLCRIFVVGVLFFTILFPLSVYVLGNNLQFLQSGGAASTSNAYNNAGSGFGSEPVTYAVWQQQYYLQHAQCRSCLRNAPRTSEQQHPGVASYLQHPYLDWVWCAMDVDNGDGSSQQQNQLHDRFGKCAEVYRDANNTLQSPCGVGYHAVSDANQCADDPSWTKQSCSSCVMDAYVWCRGIDREDVQRVLERRLHDETQGFCVDVTIDQLEQHLQAANASTDSSPTPTSCIFRETEVTALEQCHNLLFDSASVLITPPSGATLDNLFNGGSNSFYPSATGQPGNGRMPFSFFVMPILAAAFVLVRLWISRRENTGTWTTGSVDDDSNATTNVTDPYSTAASSGVYATQTNNRAAAVELSPMPRSAVVDEHHPIVIDQQHDASVPSAGSSPRRSQRQHRHYDRLVND